MKIIKTPIEDLILIEPQIYFDGRGYFFESYNRDRFAKKSPDIKEFVQDNRSSSSYGVIRGLHFQAPPFAQAKLVNVVCGRVLDVAVDLRPDSRTFGKHFSVELTDENHLFFYIPEGFAHGFSVLSPTAIFEYKCSSYYNPESERGIIWNDTDLNIDWKVPLDKVIVSEKDKKHLSFAQYFDRIK